MGNERKNKKYLETSNNNEALIITEEDKKNYWKKTIIDALEQDRVVVMYQPLADNKKNSIYLFEALVRIKDEDDRLHYPGEFLQLSKELGIYDQITRRVAEIVFETIRKHGIEVSMNIEYEDIINQETNNMFKNLLHKNCDISNKLIVELTELDVSQYKEVTKFFDDLRKFNVRVYIDDLGTGYSNLARILHLDFDGIKISGEIIKEVCKDMKSLALTELISNLAKKLDVVTVAEYVTDEDVMNKVKELDIDYSQGEFISMAVEEEEIRRFVEKTI